MSHQNTELTDQFIEFYNTYYRDEIGQLVQEYPKERKSLQISHRDLFSFDPDIADDFLAHPDDFMQYASEALRLIDLPVDVKLSNATVRLGDLPDHHIYGVGELRAEHRDQYLGVFGHIARVTACKPKITHAAFECQRCGTLTRIPQQSGDFQEPHQCQACERQGPFHINFDQSEFVDRRKIQLKQPPEDAENGEGDKITVYLEGEIADPPDTQLETRVGEDAVIYGVIELDQQGSSRDKSPVFDQYLVAHDFEFERDTDTVDVAEHKDEFTEAANSSNAYAKFLESMGRGIYPYGRWPLALRLGAAFLMGGVRVDPEDQSAFRGDVHMAIVGPPGVGKSKFSQNIAELSPGAEHRSATGLSSDVGLTAAAVQDDFADGDGWVLKPGILPRASDHVVLDEADKTGADLSKMNDALEGPQMASIDKGGISAKLKTRVGLLAMANPDGGRWDENMGVKEQVDIDESLWSRFDGIVLLEDQPDEEQDSALAEYVLENYSTNLSREKADGDSETDRELPVSWDALKAWVKYAREELKPELTPEAENQLEEYYVDIRNDDVYSKNSHPTARKLEAGIRFATAFARIRLSETVEGSDVRMAINLSKELLSQSLNGGELDADVFTEAEEATQKKRKQRIQEAITGQYMTPAEIADETGVDKEQVDRDLEKWHQRTNPSPVTRNSDGEYRWIT